MALIEVFHVVASNIVLDADSTTDIAQGSLVALNASGQVIPCDSAGTAAINNAIGIAADSRSTGVTSFTPESGGVNQASGTNRSPKVANSSGFYTGALVVGAWGQSQRFTQNRVADQYNEVLASGKMTVYHSGGEFWTDQYEVMTTAGVAITYSPGAKLYCSTTNSTNTLNGRFTSGVATAGGASTSGQIVGYAVEGPSGYPSGVPGSGSSATSFSATEGANSLKWGTFLHVKLAI